MEQNSAKEETANLPAALPVNFKLSPTEVESQEELFSILRGRVWDIEYARPEERGSKFIELMKEFHLTRRPK
jgi:hypothetical protein